VDLYSSKNIFGITLKNLKIFNKKRGLSQFMTKLNLLVRPITIIGITNKQVESRKQPNLVIPID
jgi:hypothetical protein